MRKTTFKTLLCLGLFALTLTSCGNTNPYADDPRYPIYQLALEDGFTGTYQEWLDSIKGEDGENGQTPHIGENGNWWIGDTDTGVPATGPQGPQGPAGSDGQDGSQGPQGVPGEDGTSMLTGKGAPSADLGNIGDTYVDTDTWDVYTKTSGGWVKTGNIKGQDGQDGTSMLTGHGEPTTDLGKDGDSYIDLDTWDFYLKVDGTWVLKGNIKADSTDHNGTEGLEFYPLNDKECAVGVGTALFMKTIVVPETYKNYTVTAVIPQGFYGCPVLEEIILPDTITMIGSYAFAYCDYLTKIRMSSAIENINANALLSKNLQFNYHNNDIYLGNEENPYVLYLANINGDSGVRIMDGCKKIVEGMDYRFNKVYIPISVENIHSYAFDVRTSIFCQASEKPASWNVNWTNSAFVYWGQTIEDYEAGPKYLDYNGTEVQGVTAEKILIGNTAATTGAFAAAGVPFNVGLNAALWAYNTAGGFNGAQVELKHYDDGFIGAQGATYTKQLVEDDKVFAIVGHFGTNTVMSTVDYIKEQGVPMLYAASGVNDLYQEGAVGYSKAVMPVQPIYKTEGRVMLARAAAMAPHGFGATNIGVIYTSDDAGLGMVDGVRRQAQEASSALTITYSQTNATSGTNHASAVARVAGADLIIICANQVPFGEILNYMRDGNIDKPVITSYVSANTTTLYALAQNGSIAGNRQVFTNAWLDIASTDYFYAPETTNIAGTFLWDGYKSLVESLGFAGLYDYGVPGCTQEYWGIAETITGYLLSIGDYTNAFEYSYNSYALAGYVAGKMFTDSLQRVDDANKDLTWLNFINAIESSPLDVPMSAEIDFANGNRLGIASLALNTFDTTTAQLASVAPLTSLDDIWAAVPAFLKK